MNLKTGGTIEEALVQYQRLTDGLCCENNYDLGFPWEVYNQDHTDQSGVSEWAVIDWDWNQSRTPNCIFLSCS